jgi:hypothetical protein
MHLTVSRQAPTESPMAVDIDRSASIRDLQTLFSEFVAQRKGDHYSADFATRFLERGTTALQEAQQRVTDSELEGGGA